MTRNINISLLRNGSVEAQPVEICEHKGTGHPDTLCDAVCEAASRALSKAYLEQYGRVLHHNLDKGLLVAGKSVPRFGGGVLEMPMKLIICGRALPIENMGETVRIVLDAARQELELLVPHHADDFGLHAEIQEGSDNLRQVFAPTHEVPVANDTSFGVGYAPFSRLETAVRDAAALLNGADFRQRFLAAGRDFKVMGMRRGDELHLTIALALIDQYVESVAHYFEIKQAMHRYLAGQLPEVAGIRINTLDDPAIRDERGIYLTVTGLSCEMGDDGQVGRGNRVNGLITPGRPMSLEAAAGKNPVSHPGKLYNVLAHLIAWSIIESIDAIDAVSVKLLSAIGQPIDQPQMASIEVATAAHLTPATRERIRAITDTWLANTREVTNLILSGKVHLY